MWAFTKKTHTKKTQEIIKNPNKKDGRQEVGGKKGIGLHNLTHFSVCKLNGLHCAAIWARLPKLS